MTYEEFISRARHAPPDQDLHRQLRGLAVEGGTLCQLAHQVLELRSQLQEAMTSTLMIDETAIKRCIGIQGQVMGMDQVLVLMCQLMQPQPAAKEASHEDS